MTGDPIPQKFLERMTRQFIACGGSSFFRAADQKGAGIMRSGKWRSTWEKSHPSSLHVLSGEQVRSLGPLSLEVLFFGNFGLVWYGRISRLIRFAHIIMLWIWESHEYCAGIIL